MGYGPGLTSSKGQIRGSTSQLNGLRPVITSLKVLSYRWWQHLNCLLETRQLAVSFLPGTTAFIHWLTLEIELYRKSYFYSNLQ
jgi:hypothetical protein